jgi:hypothetical protein
MTTREEGGDGTTIYIVRLVVHSRVHERAVNASQENCARSRDPNSVLGPELRGNSGTLVVAYRFCGCHTSTTKDAEVATTVSWEVVDNEIDRIRRSIKTIKD